MKLKNTKINDKSNKVDKINNIREYSLGKSSFPTLILVATIFNAAC